MKLQNIVKFIREWYTGVRIPNLLTSEFGYFASRTKYIVNDVIGNQAHQFTIITDTTASAGYVSRDSKDRSTIVIPGWYFSPTAFEEMKFQPSSIWPQLALAMIRGSTLHEALHIKLSPNDLVEFYKLGGSIGMSMFENYGKLFMDAINIIEDVFIEAYLEQDKYLSFWHPFIDAKNSLLFRKNQLDALYDNFSPKGMEKPNGSYVLDLLVTLKNNDLRDLEMWEDPILTPYYNVIMKATNPELSPVGRLQLAIDLVTMLEKDPNVKLTEEEKKKPSDSDMVKMGMFGGMDSGDSERIPPELKKVINRLGSSTDPLLSATLEAFAAESKTEAASKDAYEAQSFLFDIKQDCPSMMMNMGRPTYPRIELPELKELSVFLSFMDKKTRPSPPKLSGCDILPDRIATALSNPEIFSDITEKQLGKPEFVYLVDCSGSTTSRRGFKYTKLFDDECNVAEQLFEFTFGTGATVVGFSTSGDIKPIHAGMTVKDPGHDQNVMIVVASRGMAWPDSPAIEIDERFELMKKIRCVENFDGHAIKTAAENLFTRRNRTKVLFVLSDGEPSADDYRGEPALNHTRSVVDEVRSSGIVVIALALTDAAKEAAVQIYGEEYTIDCTKGDLAQQARDAVESVLMAR